MAKTIKIEKLSSEVNGLLVELSKVSIDVFKKVVREFPRRAEREAKQQYHNFLKAISGQLLNEIEGFSQADSGDGSFIMGLKNKKEYAAIQHFGGTIPAHFIKPVRAKALHWISGGQDRFSKGHMIPARTIRPKPFLKTPLLAVAKVVTKEILRDIKFKR